MTQYLVKYKYLWPQYCSMERLADTVSEGDRITQDGLWIAEVVDTDAEQRTMSGMESAVSVKKEDDPDADVKTFTDAQINLYWTSLE